MELKDQKYGRIMEIRRTLRDSGLLFNRFNRIARENGMIEDTGDISHHFTSLQNILYAQLEIIRNGKQ